MVPKKVQLVQLCYLVHSQPKHSSFPIKIRKSENVHALKIAIKEETRSLLDNIALSNLILYQLLDPLDMIEEKFLTLPSKHVYIIVELPASSNVADTQKRKVSLSKIDQADLDKLLNRFRLNKAFITLIFEIDWYNSKPKKDLLFLDKVLSFSISGMKDVVVANKLFAKVHDLCNGIHVGFEIKKKFQDSHIHQAILSNNKKVIQCPVTLLHAINIIETILVKDTSGSIRSTKVTNPIAMRINFRNLQDNLQGNLQYEYKEKDGLKQLLNSPKVNFKIDNDIANMNNMLEVTTKKKMLH
ncbi:crinkler family protein [Gigaspora margarita]|uniref:Crinkler family protein n=1 Tax=Gigaspora margarita TaxID=4874 RepID=A0A8H4EQ28_GIGMA|nr:crinkler family protein [Gigaspora margarita]